MGGQIADLGHALARHRAAGGALERRLNGRVQVVLEVEPARAGRGISGAGMPAALRVSHADELGAEMRHAGTVDHAEALGNEALERAALAGCGGREHGAVDRGVHGGRDPTKRRLTRH
jgi:hypothetical protein